MGTTAGRGGDSDKSTETVSPLAQKKKGGVVVDESFITVDLHHANV
jgi:hypothetical protein